MADTASTSFCEPRRSPWHKLLASTQLRATETFGHEGVKAQVADAEAMRRFCDDALPGMLTDACGVAPDRASSVATDVMARAESICGLSYRQQEVLAAPFFEESFDHEPDDASLWQKAVTTVVIRNSELEELHVDGIVDSGGITAITTFGLGPLSHLRAARESSMHGSDLTAPQPLPRAV